jgi:mono/diheme cytochrome c family protein
MNRNYHFVAAAGLLLFALKARAADPQQLARGEYIARAGDCVACHTAPKTGKAFAGGYPLGTPLGGSSIRRTSRRTKQPALAPGAMTTSRS